MELNMCKLVLVVTCCDLRQVYTAIALAFISRVELVDYAVDGEGGSAEILVWGDGNGEYGLKIWRIKPSDPMIC